MPKTYKKPKMSARSSRGMRYKATKYSGGNNNVHKMLLGGNVKSDLTLVNKVQYCPF